MLGRPIQEIVISTSFEALGLRAELIRAVADEGYAQPTPVQAQAIPVVLQGKDVIVGAQTGTGKTAGFVLPLLQMLAAKPTVNHHIRVLILTPTRELAAQVEQSVRTYGRHLRIRSAAVFGGVNINPQIQALKRGVDILVATPGRLLDHAASRTVDLSKVEFLVLDEADRMLDMGFIPAIRRVLGLLPKNRQNLFFSATFPREIRALADSFLRSPVEIAVARRKSTADLINQVVHPVDKERKRALLSYLIGSGDWRQVLVFTRTKHGANRLAEQLEKDGIGAVAIHGNKSQGARTRALAGFKNGSVRVLVATDIAARGLDIEELPHVVNYDLPNVPEDYVHRIGRTGRAGSSGAAVSLVCGEEDGFLRDIERLIGQRIERVNISGFERGSAPSAAERHARESTPERAPHSHGRRNQGRPQAAGQRKNGQQRPRGRDERREDKQGNRNRRGAPAQPRTAVKSHPTHGSAQAQPKGQLHNAMRAVAALFGGNRDQ
ncbi:MAG: DEAD/DEAH box helicase [Burkholderiales bacterium]